MSLEAAARAIRSAEHLLVTAGAGMGVDSGLPDFRGDDGFWAAYPPYRGLSLGFADLASPSTFARDPALAWGFYGHRQALYRRAVPHAGFGVLRRWAATKRSAFVLTSNVDGQFAAAGFDADAVHELHGSIHHLQCTRPCSSTVAPADGVTVRVDEATMRALEPLPRCPACGALARPNILMFGDGAWVGARSAEQEERFDDWLDGVPSGALCVIELGAGTVIPTIRRAGELLVRRHKATLVRVNPRQAEGPAGTIGIAAGALAALTELEGRVLAA